VQSPIFPGEYSQFCPSLVHVVVGFCDEPSTELPAEGHPTRARKKMIENRTVLSTG
jgi:hypothetical protein